LSCESWDDGLLGKATALLPRRGEIIAVGTADALDQAEGPQAGEQARYRAGRELIEDEKKVGAVNAGDIEGRSLKGTQEPLFDGIEEIDALDGLAGRDARSGKTIKGSGAGREIIEGREGGEITAIAANQDLAKVGPAVDACERKTRSVEYSTCIRLQW
jgi:hypothetical protein